MATDSNAAVPVLIAGAGPTGLSLALQLAVRGTACRIIDKARGPGETSRAMGVQARTLEFYDQLGFAQEVVELGTPMDSVTIRNGAKTVARIDFSEMGKGLSPFPFMLGFPQDEHERFLIGKLAALGVEIEWNTSLDGFTQDDQGVLVTTSSGSKTAPHRAQYLCGCDGSHSRVREVAGIGFPGGTYDQLFWLADVHATGKPVDEMFGHIDREAMVMMMTVRSSGTQRLVGFVPKRFDGREAGTFEDLRPMVERMLGIKIGDVEWFSTYRVHHRVVDRFRDGRVFLLGDAGHVHSPAGGQGMNTGIGDAVNLGWKLAQVLQGRASEALLATYEPERIPFARALVRTTDRSFEMVIDQGLKGTLLRNWIIPRVAPLAARFATFRRMLFRAMSQIRIEYRNSALSVGQGDDICGGNRLPWLPAASGSNFDALRSLDWQVHIYGQAYAGLREDCVSRGLALHQYDATTVSTQAGLKRDAYYLVRPDGYVGLVADGADATALKLYIERFALRFLIPDTAAKQST